MNCFIDTMRPVTPAEKAAWSFYLSLHRDCWLPARIMFRRVYVGAPRTEAMLAFVSETGITDAQMLGELERVLQGLAGEAGQNDKLSFSNGRGEG